MIYCAFCTRPAAGALAAIDAGWYPGYYIGDEEVANPVCPHCVGIHVRHDGDGELELIEDAPVIAEAGHQVDAAKCR